MEEATQDIQRMEKKRPTLTDPTEMEIIRSIYFKDENAYDVLNDPEMKERDDRYRRKQNYKRKSSR